MRPCVKPTATSEQLDDPRPTAINCQPQIPYEPIEPRGKFPRFCCGSSVLHEAATAQRRTTLQNHHTYRTYCPPTPPASYYPSHRRRSSKSHNTYLPTLHSPPEKAPLAGLAPARHGANAKMKTMLLKTRSPPLLLCAPSDVGAHLPAPLKVWHRARRVPAPNLAPPLHLTTAPQRSRRRIVKEPPKKLNAC